MGKIQLKSEALKAFIATYQNNREEQINLKNIEIEDLSKTLATSESDLRRTKEELGSKERAVARLEKELEDKEGIFLYLKRQIEAKEKDLKSINQQLENGKESINELEGKISLLVKEKEEITGENNKLNQESRTYQHKVFELQAKIIDTEIEVAKIKKEQVGPIVKKR